MDIGHISGLINNAMMSAQPAKMQAMQDRILSNVQSSQSEGVKEAFATVFEKSNLSNSRGVTGALAEAAKPKSESEEAHEQFEAMVLTNFVQSMLPTDAESIFGEGTAGDMWKSMMAKEIATVMAKAGGIGIAASLSGDQLNDVDRNAATSNLNSLLQKNMFENSGDKSAAQQY